jgi:hypothetical protein
MCKSRCPEKAITKKATASSFAETKQAKVEEPAAV